MKKETIKDKNKVLVLILRKGSFPEGLNFHTEDKDFIQVATWHYDKGKKTVPHAHKIAERRATRTQEVICVKKGKLRAEFFTDNGKPLEKKILKAGDVAVIFGGGHSFEILESGTQVLEVKNGPYLGTEKDKKTFD